MRTRRRNKSQAENIFRITTCNVVVHRVVAGAKDDNGEQNRAQSFEVRGAWAQAKRQPIKL
jgi:hypothetical protein